MGKRSRVREGPAGIWGKMLVHYRERASLSQAKLAELINYSAGQVASVETGRRAPSEDFAKLCDEVTGACGALLTLFDQFLGHGGFMPGFEDWPDFEYQASMLRGFESTLVPGLMQIPDYVSAVLSLAGQAAVEARLARQDVLIRDNPPVVRYVIDEWVLRHLVGDADVMRRQLQHLEDVMTGDRAYIQVIPSDVLPGTTGAFALASVSGLTVGYEESTTHVRILTGEHDLHRLEVVFHRLLAEADSPARSLETIRNVKDEIWKT